MGLTEPETVKLVDRAIADAMMERAEANARGDTNAPTITDISRRVLAALQSEPEWRALARLRDRSAFERQVNGALRSAIDAHGPVTRGSVSGASKRVASQVYAWLRPTGSAQLLPPGTEVVVIAPRSVYAGMRARVVESPADRDRYGDWEVYVEFGSDDPELAGRAGFNLDEVSTP